MKTNLTIHTVYVPINSQSEADACKKVCEDYGLPMWNDRVAFYYLKSEKNNYFMVGNDKEFAIYSTDKKLNKKQITLSHFIELCEEWKKEQYELKFCENCIQMTNHFNSVCQKCKIND